MEPIYAAATAIVDRTQPNLDGGILAFTLNNLIVISSNDQINSTSSPKHRLIDHVLSTFARTGYALATVVGLVWSIILLVSGIFICYRSDRKKKYNTVPPTRIEQNQSEIDHDDPTLPLRIPPSPSARRLFYRKREQIQSYWLCLALQFLLFILLAVLFGTGVLLGFATSSQFHANVASSPAHEEAIGRLLTSPELEHTDPPRTYLFPRLLRSLAQIRAYLSEFVYNTKNHTTPVINDLIHATEQMQEQMTTEFNTLLFEQIGVAEAFELGDQLGASVIVLIENAKAIVEQDTNLKTHFDRFKIELQQWLRLIQSYGPAADDIECTGLCDSARSLFVNNLTARPDTFIPPFSFAIALKFVTVDQNQTAENVRMQLDHGKVLAAKQLAETKKIMNKRINIPKSIRNMTDQQWSVLGTQLVQPIAMIDEVASMLIRSVAPKVASVGTVILALTCVFWIILLLLAIGVFWLIIHYHCVPASLGAVVRRRVRSVAGFSYVLLSVSMLFSVFCFLLGGYTFTEACRYFDPNQKHILVVEHDSSTGRYNRNPTFPLDSHINGFINRNWDAISSMASKMDSTGGKPIPIPHIRSPILAVLQNCRENMGILEALDAIRDFDTASLNDPEVSARFVTIGREIMIDSLKAIDVNEMFPKETDEQLAMAGRLDDFIVDFEQIREKLPVTFISVRTSDEESGNYTTLSEAVMWDTWFAYRDVVLSSRLSMEQKVKLDAATEMVRTRLGVMSAVVHRIDEHLYELTKAKKTGPVVLRLQAALNKLKTLMLNKPVLLKQANQLFDENVAAKTPEEASRLIEIFGPRMMAEVGRCRRLYEASQDLNSAVCRGVVDVVNGFWFTAGWVTLIGSITVAAALMLLLHKPPVGFVKLSTCATNSKRNGSIRRSRNLNNYVPKTCDFVTQVEVE